MNDVANIRMEMRTDILETSLAIEGMLSVFLAGLLGIKIDPDTTNSFSNKSSALSFANKIHLLIDIGALDKEMKLKYFTFMEIRNQFMHNIKIRSYEHFFTEYLSDKKKYVLSHYKTDKKRSQSESRTSRRNVGDFESNVQSDRK